MWESDTVQKKSKKNPDCHICPENTWSETCRYETGGHYHQQLPVSTRPESGAEGAATVPCEGTANAQVQLLPRIHGQGFVLVGVTQTVHGLADVRVGDGAEFRAINTFLPAATFVHDRLNGVQHLSVK